MRPATRRAHPTCRTRADPRSNASWGSHPHSRIELMAPGEDLVPHEEPALTRRTLEFLGRIHHTMLSSRLGGGHLSMSVVASTKIRDVPITHMRSARRDPTRGASPTWRLTLASIAAARSSYRTGSSSLGERNKRGFRNRFRYAADTCSSVALCARKPRSSSICRTSRGSGSSSSSMRSARFASPTSRETRGNCAEKAIGVRRAVIRGRAAG